MKTPLSFALSCAALLCACGDDTSNTTADSTSSGDTQIDTTAADSDTATAPSDSDASSDVVAPVEKPVTASDGGTVVAFGATLDIPAGALAGDTTIVVTELAAAAIAEDAEVEGAILELGPGGTYFSDAVSLSLPAPASIDAGKQVVVSWRGAEGDGWVDMPTTVAGGLATTELQHFSQYAVRVIPINQVAPNDLAVIEACETTACGGDPTGDWAVLGVCAPDTSFIVDGCPEATSRLRGFGDGLLTLTGTELRSTFFATPQLLVHVPASCSGITSCTDVRADCEGTLATDCECPASTVESNDETTAYTIDQTSLVVGGDHLSFCVRDELGRRRLRIALPNAQIELGRTLARTASFSSDHYGNCALLADDGIRCWGNNAYGQAAAPSTKDFKAVSVGWWHACGLKKDGTIQCWGNQAYGRATPPAGTYKQLDSGGFYHRCAIRSDGSIACWGKGLPPNNLPPAGIYTPPSGTNFVRVAGGDMFSCALDANGTIRCWGNGYAGATTPPGGAFKGFDCGGSLGCGIRSDGTLACWGQVAAPPTGDDYATVACGDRFCCATRADSSLACWGDIAAPPSGSFSEVHGGFGHACARRTDGSLLCWGRNDYGQGAPP